MGHEAGDELIIGASECISKVFNQFGKCYRTGGDEFIVLANLSRNEANEAITRLKKETLEWCGKRVKGLHLSAGYALAADHPNLLAEKLVNEADLAMYAEKNAYYREIQYCR